MILILSSSFDVSTQVVSRWLNHLNKKFIICSTENPIIDYYITGEELNSYFKFYSGEVIYLSEIKSYWYRRGGFVNFNEYIKTDSFYFNKKRLEFFYEEELKTINYFLNYLLETKKNIGNYTLSMTINKLIVLNEAKKQKLNIPDFVIINTKEQFIKLNKISDSLITKPLSDTFTSEKNGYITKFITSSVNVKKVPMVFFPSLIQNKIDKLFEVRTFYLNGLFFSMVIFSQSNEISKIDFRNYDKNFSLNYTPFQLPINVENKLGRLMKKLKLNTGSIDLIYSTNRKFYFLEVNPAGQFEMVSEPCNFYIEKTIAELL